VPAAAPVAAPPAACGCAPAAAPADAPAVAPAAAPEIPAAAPAQAPEAPQVAPPAEPSTSFGIAAGSLAPSRTPVGICGNAGALGGVATATCEGTASSGRLVSARLG
jgi:hypothetical protein